MTDQEYQTTFLQRDLPTDFDVWQKIAGGLVDALKKENVDMFYINQAEHFRSTLTLLPAASALNVYAEPVLKADAQIRNWGKADATPDDVREICEQYEQTVAAYSPSRKIRRLFVILDELRNDLAKLQRNLDDVADEIDGIADDANELKENVAEFKRLFKEIQ